MRALRQIGEGLVIAVLMPLCVLTVMLVGRAFEARAADLVTVFTPQPPAVARRSSDCRPMTTTGYVRSEFSSHTFDGTPIATPEPIAAASWDIPIDSQVWVEGVGTFRIADRGMLGSSGWIDVAVWSRAEAFEITGTRLVCVLTPGEEE